MGNQYQIGTLERGITGNITHFDHFDDGISIPSKKRGITGNIPSIRLLLVLDDTKSADSTRRILVAIDRSAFYRLRKN